MAEGDVKMLYASPTINGKRVMVFECGRPPADEFGEPDVAAFALDESPNRNVYYEATDMTVSWFRSPFYVGTTAPSDKELEFQLQKWHGDRQMKFSVAATVLVGVLIWSIYR